jgi:HEPN domain-containing protein
MSEFLLDFQTRKRINQYLPDLKGLQKLVLACDPDMVAIGFGPKTTIPEAIVCLKDSFDTLWAARYALREAYANRIWHLEKNNPPDDVGANMYSRFYLDDVTLRLYSAGEHLAVAITKMLEINPDELKPYYKRNRVSLQSIVAHFLLAEKAGHSITQAVLKLGKSREWHKAMRYRNTWVHDQPPTIKGLGMVFKRGTRWKRKDNYYEIPLGEGDEPDYTVEDLFNFIKPVLFQFTETFEKVIDFYIDLVEKESIFSEIIEPTPQMPLLSQEAAEAFIRSEQANDFKGMAEVHRKAALSLMQNGMNLSSIILFREAVECKLKAALETRGDFDPEKHYHHKINELIDALGLSLDKLTRDFIDNDSAFQKRWDINVGYGGTRTAVGPHTVNEDQAVKEKAKLCLATCEEIWSKINNS